jgi:hypothetical protein
MKLNPSVRRINIQNLPHEPTDGRPNFFVSRPSVTEAKSTDDIAHVHLNLGDPLALDLSLGHDKVEEPTLHDRHFIGGAAN